ncbi:MAG: DUF3108 domain-containing protein [Dehalococcoidia bacterium]|nr:DUF3108 domain-containing protein [Dehalococcoidia bacterium]
MKFPPVRLIGAALGAAVLLAACGGGDPPPTSKIFVGPTWNGAETGHYELLDDGGQLYGQCTLETEPSGETLTIRRLCGDAAGEGFRDDGMAVVDAETLQPIESERVVVRPDDQIRNTWTGDYREDVALLAYEQINLETDEVEDSFETERELPEPTEDSPDPGYYDDESLFWLLRGIPLEEGWEDAYHNVNLGTARIVVAEVLVEEQETIEVPAGEFETWRVRIRTESITQRVWIEAAEPHRMIRANIEDLTYELESFEPES